MPKLLRTTPRCTTRQVLPIQIHAVFYANKEQVMANIDTSLNLLQTNRAATEKAAINANALSLGEQSDPSGFAAPTASKPIDKTPEQQAAIKEVTDFLKGEKGKKAALTMQTMVTAATPILNNFDELLVIHCPTLPEKY